MAEEPVQYTLEGQVAVIRLDDGKANALSHEMLDAVNAGFDRAQEDGAGAVAVIGRPGRFSAGFDLSVMSQGPDAVAALVAKGAGLALRIFDCPTPVVLGVTGHALAMGAVLCLSADERIGSEGAYKLGLNEVAIKMTLPDFALVLADDRLRPGGICPGRRRGLKSMTLTVRWMRAILIVSCRMARRTRRPGCAPLSWPIPCTGGPMPEPNERSAREPPSVCVPRWKVFPAF